MPRGRPKGSGKQVKQVPLQYDDAELVEELAKELIAEHHTHLVNSNIAYLYKNKPMSQKGRTIIATAEKCSKKVKAISSRDFVIVVSYEAYNKLTDKQKRAVIDHELEHCLVDEDDEGNEVTKIIPHDVEEFYCIIARHKLYKSDLIALGRVVENLREDDEDPGLGVEDEE
jgi:DNA-binding FrmR family transcriptional regulator